MNTRSRLLWPWRFDGTVGAGAYFLAGVLLFLLKWGMDTYVATVLFHRSWSPSNYLIQGQIPFAFEARERRTPLFLVTMVSLSLPFVAAGVALTVRRLRALAMPLWLTVLFFPGIINLLFFVLLIVLRPVGKTDEARPLEEESSISRSGPTWKSAAVSGMITAVIGMPLTVLTIYGLGVYGAGLFVGLPFCLGVIAAVLHGYTHPRSCKECLKAAGFGVVFLGFGLFFGHLEGFVCLLMASPLVVGCAMVGATVGYYIQLHARNEREIALLVIALVLTVPALMGAESKVIREPLQMLVRTEIKVDRSPAEVWSNVVSFPELPPPEEWLFRSGIAYPIGASIAGRGVGAERRCVFSTGSFVEPIEEWDEARLLKFSVTSNPPPMREWSLFADIHPPHLNGFMVSQAGQFLLDPMPDGGTRLEGSTWYEHKLWPSEYWQLWSDAIIHRIHLRVLRHVKQLAEHELVEPSSHSLCAVSRVERRIGHTCEPAIDCCRERRP